MHNAVISPRISQPAPAPVAALEPVVVVRVDSALVADTVQVLDTLLAGDALRGELVEMAQRVRHELTVAHDDAVLRDIARRQEFGPLRAWWERMRLRWARLWEEVTTC